MTRPLPRILLASVAVLPVSLAAPAAPPAAGPGDPIVVFADRLDHVAGHRDGVQTAPDMYQNYREPQVLTANDGSVVAICQAGNKLAWPERSGQDLVVKTSRDGGRTWSAAKVAAEHDEFSICPAATVYDRQAGRIVVLYTLHQWPFSEGRQSPTLQEKREKGLPLYDQFMLQSDDNGATWTKPIKITSMMREPNSICVFGSGEGIQLTRGPHRGRLIVAGGDFTGGKKVYAYYSDDHGKTWKFGEPAPIREPADRACETKIAELSDGTLLLNSRTFLRGGDESRRRTRARSKDGGVSWSPLENDPALETVSCNGALIAAPRPDGPGDVLLCSVPLGPKRTHGAIYVSFDGGETWPLRKLVVPEFFAYSSLLVLPDGAIGLFYEAQQYREIRLVRIPLRWLCQDPAP